MNTIDKLLVLLLVTGYCLKASRLFSDRTGIALIVASAVVALILLIRFIKRKSADGVEGAALTPTVNADEIDD